MMFCEFKPKQTLNECIRKVFLIKEKNPEVPFLAFVPIFTIIYMIIMNIKHIIILMGVRFASIGSNDLDLIHKVRLESV